MSVCPTCNRNFEPATQNRIYCSRPCYWGRDQSIVMLRAHNIEEKTPENADIWFWANTQKVDGGCIEWTGTIKDNGYGVVARAFGAKKYYAHRASFRLTNGSDAGTVVRHTCDNRRCVNPDHLIGGTIYDNIQDAVERGRIAHGEGSAMSKLTSDQVQEIRRSKLTHAELSRVYGVSDSTILRARSGETWARLPS